MGLAIEQGYVNGTRSVSHCRGPLAFHTFALYFASHCHEALCGLIYYQAPLPVVLQAFAHLSFARPAPANMQTRDTIQANAPAVKMLQPPPTESSPNSRPLSIMTTGTTATAQDKSGETWKVHVTEENCWEDLILTLGTYSFFQSLSLARRISRGWRSTWCCLHKVGAYDVKVAGVEKDAVAQPM